MYYFKLLVSNKLFHFCGVVSFIKVVIVKWSHQWSFHVWAISLNQNNWWSLTWVVLVHWAFMIWHWAWDFWPGIAPLMIALLQTMRVFMWTYDIYNIESEEWRRHNKTEQWLVSFCHLRHTGRDKLKVIWCLVAWGRPPMRVLIFAPLSSLFLS